MSSKQVMSEVKDLIAFYEARGWNWLLAAEFTLRRKAPLHVSAP